MTPNETHGTTRAAPRHIRALLWFHDQRYGVIARYRTWALFRAWPWRWLPAPVKRRIP